MDNDLSINQNKDDAGDSLKQSDKTEDEEIKEPAHGDGVPGGDQSLIEVKPEIPIVDLLDVEEETTAKTEAPQVKKHNAREEAPTNEEGKKRTVKKELAEEANTNGMVDTCKGGELKTEADTLILEIDNSDNLDAYLERTKNKTVNNGSTDEHSLDAQNLNNTENNKLIEGTPAKQDKIEENITTPEKTGSPSLTNANTSKRNTLKKEPAKKRSVLKASATLSLADKAEKIAEALQQNTDESKEAPRSDGNKSQIELETKPKIEKDSDKPIKTLNESSTKSEDKKVDTRFIWISNISKNTKATDLKLHLTSYGKVMTARIVTDGKSYYGYVVMEKRGDVNKCIKSLDDTIFEGRKIRLSDRGPEKKTSKNQNVEQDKAKTDSISPKQIQTNTVKEKNDRTTPKRSRSRDLLTLKTKTFSRRYDRFSEERRRRKNEEILRRERASQERRRTHEMEREREVRRKQKIKEEEYRQTELKLERDRKKLEREREMIERERLDLLRLQKKLADSERHMLTRQKVEIERNIREDYKKRESPGEFGDVRRNKFARIEVVESRRTPENKDYWKSERRTPSVTGKKECFETQSYPAKKSGREDKACVAPPPPPIILSDNFDLSDRRHKEKEREWDSRGYDKKEFSERPGFKDRKIIEDYNFGDRRDCGQEKSYDRERYKSKYEKSPIGSWERPPSLAYKSVPSSASWKTDVMRVIPRYPPPPGFPLSHQLGSASGITHYYSQQEYPRQNEFYGHPPERKY